MMKFKKSDNYINDLNIVKQLAQNMRESVIIKGLNGINSASMYKNKMNYDLVDNDYLQKDEWVVNTNGINLEILTLNGVDNTRTYSNDIYEIYELLGIEAARTVLMNEIKEVIDNSGNYVNYDICHSYVIL